MAVDIRLEHLVGGRIAILRDEQYEVSHPVLELGKICARETAGSALHPIPIATPEVLRDQDELDARETLSEHRVIHVGPRQAGTIAYEVTLRFLTGWKEN